MSTDIVSTAGPATGGPPDERRPGRSIRPWYELEIWLYVGSAVLTSAAVVVMTRLWRASLTASPFTYAGDAISSAMYFKTVLQTGWYEYQPDLGAPYGQHLHDFPFSDQLQPFMIKLLGLLSTNWVFVFNFYYLLGFPLAAVTAVLFLRRCGLSRVVSLVLSVLYATTPYHFIRGQSHYFLGEYWAVPLGLTIVLAVIRGEPLWGRRARLPGPIQALPAPLRGTIALASGRGAGTVLAVALVTLDGAYYGVFCGILMVPAGILALLRTWDWRRFGGVVMAGLVLGVVFVGAMVDDVLYERANGSNSAAFVRHHRDAEIYAAKFLSLILPAFSYPIRALGRLRTAYETSSPFGGERTALGTMAAIGFLLLLGAIFVVLLRRNRPAEVDPEAARRRQTFGFLSALTWFAFLAGSVGGFGTLISFLTPSIRGWNRISIFIALMALAGLGLVVEGAVHRYRARPATATPHAARRWFARAGRSLPAVATVILVLGVADQSLLSAHVYNSDTYASDDQFVRTLQTMIPSGSMVFQDPYVAFPEGGRIGVSSVDSDSLRPWLHSTTLRWSGGGIKGRPQTNWPAAVVKQPVATMVRNLAIAGFVGILVDRDMTADNGSALEAKLQSQLGAPLLVSTNQEWAYYSLSRQLTEVATEMSPTERARAAARIVGAAS
ncbi:hypothetical protein SAMN04515671_2789 [Nakamurella panacisegetis]|uniref:Uncharacterized protein n=1 Tax=Nakamurella panacisegetis TaxID=1090615 RepID=A0A1H0PIB2_9ACTN|nr:hypothetical protein [Nakamurella panacisegetis]SDP04801.1 hypothetical protein SAMN04515671_2789 [Nakamurella panacisegetis]